MPRWCIPCPSGPHPGSQVLRRQLRAVQCLCSGQHGRLAYKRCTGSGMKRHVMNKDSRVLNTLTRIVPPNVPQADLGLGVMTLPQRCEISGASGCFVVVIVAIAHNGGYVLLLCDWSWCLPRVLSIFFRFSRSEVQILLQILGHSDTSCFVGFFFI